MGRAKQEWMEYLESEAMHDWIDENYGPDAGEEGSESWNEAVQAFDDYCNEQKRLEWEIRGQEEYDYYIYLTLKDADSIFNRDITELKNIISSPNSNIANPTYCKMIYAHAVTILEVYLEDMIKALIMSNQKYLENAIKNVRPFCNTKYKLNEISLDNDGIKKFVLGKLSDNSLHNIPKAVIILSGVTEKKFDIPVDDICNVTTIRHDIVHRNGKNKEGQILKIDGDTTISAINTVEIFINNLRDKL